VLLFALDLDEDVVRPELARLRFAGYCPVSNQHFPATGRLTVLRACPAA